MKASLNLNGKSPLVAHFLQLHKITAPFNLVIHIPHREIENLPPYPLQCLYQTVVIKHYEKRYHVILFYVELSNEL